MFFAVSCRLWAVGQTGMAVCASRLVAFCQITFIKTIGNGFQRIDAQEGKNYFCQGGYNN